MKKRLIILSTFTLLFSATLVHAQFGIGADAVSRYVWRGTDFGNSASIQPALSYAAGNLEVGAWGSYALTDGGANENDLYVSYSIGNFGLTLTDYYFPESGDAFNYSDEDAIHFLEASGSYTLGSFSILAGYFFSGDEDRSLYTELGYDFYENEGTTAALALGVGDGVYVADGTDLNLVNIALTVSKDNLFASYVINPESETNFLIFGYSF